MPPALHHVHRLTLTVALRFITESPKFRDVSPERRPAARPRGKALRVHGELCLLDRPHAVVFARPTAVQAYPGHRLPRP